MQNNEVKQEPGGLIPTGLAATDISQTHRSQRQSLSGNEKSAQSSGSKAPTPWPMSFDKPKRVRWTADLHNRFVEAVGQVGGPEKATPTAIVKAMGIQGLTIFHIKSHLQKYRSNLREMSQSSRGNENSVDTVLPPSTLSLQTPMYEASVLPAPKRHCSDNSSINSFNQDYSVSNCMWGNVQTVQGCTSSVPLFGQSAGPSVQAQANVTSTYSRIQLRDTVVHPAGDASPLGAAKQTQSSDSTRKEKEQANDKIYALQLKETSTGLANVVVDTAGSTVDNTMPIAKSPNSQFCPTPPGYCEGSRLAQYYVQKTLMQQLEIQNQLVKQLKQLQGCHPHVDSQTMSAVSSESQQPHLPSTFTKSGQTQISSPKPGQLANAHSFQPSHLPSYPHLMHPSALQPSMIDPTTYNSQPSPPAALPTMFNPYLVTDPAQHTQSHQPFAHYPHTGMGHPPAHMSHLDSQPPLYQLPNPHMPNVPLNYWVHPGWQHHPQAPLWQQDPTGPSKPSVPGHAKPDAGGAPATQLSTKYFVDSTADAQQAHNSQPPVSHAKVDESPIVNAALQMQGPATSAEPTEKGVAQQAVDLLLSTDNKLVGGQDVVEGQQLMGSTNERALMNDEGTLDAELDFLMY